MSDREANQKAIWRDNFLVAGSVIGVLGAIAVAAWMIFIRTPVETDQIGYRGVAMEVVEFADDKVAKRDNHHAPDEIYPVEPDDGSTERAGEIYENVQVLGHLSDDNFNRFMAQITEWVSPEQGCEYCHANADGEIENFAGDDNYAKVVSRRMIQMTQDINANWDAHVNSRAGEGEQVAGVNCYTCHRGMNVPANLWFLDPDSEAEKADAPFMGSNNGQNTPVDANGFTDLNVEPFSAYILRNEGARVIDQVSITNADGASIQKTELTYSFMIHQSRALGVNCTFCHNSRAFTDWEQSPPQRRTAWFGQEMARHLNVEYLDPLQPVYPEHRLGPLGDAPKANCATCHQGVNKPLHGADMISGYPSLAAPGPAEMQDPPQITN